MTLSMIGKTGVKEFRELFLFLLLYTISSLIVIFSGHAYLGTIDDPYLREFLFHGENRTLIMSYPLSTLLSFLYQKFPDIQWFSWTLTLYIAAIYTLFSIYLVQFKDRFVRYLLAIFGLVVLLYVWMNITVTIVTLLMVVVAIPLIKKDQILFWLYLVASSMLRDTILISVSPLILLAYIYMFDKSYFDYKRVLAILCLIFLIFSSIYSPSTDKPYRDWLDFYHARVYFTDLHGDDEKHLFSDDEKLIAYSWFAQDESLLSTEKIVMAAGSKLEVIKHGLATLSLRGIASKFYHHKILFVLLFFTYILLRRYEKSRSKTLLLVTFVVGFFTLLFIRDVERVTYPMIFLWFTLLAVEFLKYEGKRYLRNMTLASILMLLIDLPLYGKAHVPEYWDLRNELVGLIEKRKDSTYEPSLGFPSKVEGNFATALDQNRLFFEKEWISNYIVPAGWMSRHPFFYETHDISFEGVQRTYSSYYDYLMGPKALFVGSKGVNGKINERILRMYDRVHPLDKNCRHAVVKIDESKHFALFKVVPECSEKDRKSLMP